jgi:hypothetical protein
MSNRSIPLWIEPAENSLYKDWQVNNPAEALVFKQGDKIDFELHLVRRVTGQSFIMEEMPFPDGCTIRFAIGRIHKLPTSGEYSIAYGGDVATVQYNATAAQISTALNALASITAAGGVQVAAVGTSMFSISFVNNGARTDITTDASGLIPSSTAKVLTLREGSVSAKEICLIKLSQIPCVYQAVWTDPEQPVVTVSTLATNKSKRVSISPTPKAGTWLMTATKSVSATFEKNSVTTPTTPQIESAFAVNHSKSFSYDAAPTDFSINTSSDLSEFSDKSWGMPRFQSNVIKSENHAWDFTLRTDYEAPSGYTFPLTVDGGGLIGFKSKLATVSFNTVEVEYLLNGSSSADAVLEIEVEDASGSKWTVLQTSCKIENDLIDQSEYTLLPFDEPVGEAPIDGQQYVRVDGGWQVLNIDGGTY